MIDLSIVVTCFDKRPFVPEFIRLSLELLDAGIEVVVVDDGSTDGSAALLGAHVQMNPQIKFIALRQNQGSANARNLGVEACKRRYIFFLDIDDNCNLVNLQDSVKELSTTNSDLLIANLKVLPQNDLFRMPADVQSSTQFEMNAISSKILETMGYSRFIYSRKFIIEYSLRFFPIRPESQFHNFILDDAFWLLLISASESTALVCEKERVVYYYNAPVSTQSSWTFYVTQLQLIPNLVMTFLNTFLQNTALDRKLLIENSTKWMFQVLRPLDLNKLISSHLFSPVIIKSLWCFYRLVQLNRFILAKFYFFILFFAFKNSVRIRTRIKVGN